MGSAHGEEQERAMLHPLKGGRCVTLGARRGSGPGSPAAEVWCGARGVVPTLWRPGHLPTGQEPQIFRPCPELQMRTGMGPCGLFSGSPVLSGLGMSAIGRRRLRSGEKASCLVTAGPQALPSEAP